MCCLHCGPWGPPPETRGGEGQDDLEPRSPDARPSLFPPNHSWQLRQLGLTRQLPHHRATSAQAATRFPWLRERPPVEVAEDFLSFIWAGQRLACLRCEIGACSQLFCSRLRSGQAGGGAGSLGSPWPQTSGLSGPHLSRAFEIRRTKRGMWEGAELYTRCLGQESVR